MNKIGKETVYESGESITKIRDMSEAHKIIVESSEYRAEIQKTGDEWLVNVFSGHVRLHAYETTKTLEDAVVFVNNGFIRMGGLV